ASSLDDAAYGSSAAFPRAGLARAAVNLEAVLEAPKPAVRALVIAQRGSAGLDRIFEHGLDRRHQGRGRLGRLAGSRGETAGKPHRRDAGPEQGLAGIDIAESGDQPLIEQRGLDRGGL